MSVATEKITEVQDTVLDFVARVQEPVVNGLQTVSTKAADRLPEIKIPGLGETVPTVQELVDARFAFRTKVLANQKAFATAVLRATKPVRSKFVAAPAAKSAPKVTKVKAA